MADENPVSVPIRSSFDPKGTDDAQRGFKDAGDAAKGVGESAKEAALGVKELVEAFAGILAASEVIGFLKEASEEAYKNEKALRGVAQAAILAGKDSDEAKRAVNEFTAALAIQTGVLKNDLIDAYSKVILATRDEKEAQEELTLGANIAAVKHVDMATAMRLVQAAALGVAGRFQIMTGHIVQGNTAQERSADMAKFLKDAFGNVAKATDDAAAAQDRANRRWDEFKEKIGGPVLQAVGQFRDGLAVLPRTLTLISDLSVVWADTVKAKVGALAEFMKTVWKGPQAAFAVYAAETIAIEAERDAKVKAAYAQNVAEQKKADEEKKSSVVASVKFRGDAEARFRQGESQFIESDWKKFNADILRKEKALNKYYSNVKKMREESTSDILRHFGIEETAEDELHRKIEALIKHTVAVKKAAAKLELELQVDIAKGTVALASDLFGASKETAIASAIINTYEGATKALAQGGVYGAVLAAIVIAAGFAQIAKIESTDSSKAGAAISTQGAGFDDPQNDRDARLGGRRWAGDMIREFSQGASAGWAEGMKGGGSTTNNVDNSRRTTINANIQDPSNIESVKKLIRTIRMVDSNILGQTTIASRTK